MPSRPSPDAERIIALKVGKSCIVARSPEALLRTARKHAPGAAFSQRATDGRYVITRTA